MNKVDLGYNLHKKGYNCAQSVALAFADDLNIEKETLFKISEGLGLGMGNMQNACGALTGAILIGSLKTSSGNLKNPDSKAKSYTVSKEIYDRFLKKIGAINCKDIKCIETGNPICSCDDCIKYGIEIIEEIF